MIKIAPSVLSADFTNMQKALEDLETWDADMVHCDIMDGTFVSQITFGHKMVSQMKAKTGLPLDVHLMIVNPEKHIERFIKSGADYLTLHFETVNGLDSAVKKIKDLKTKAGIAINPDTPVSKIFSVLDKLDLVLLMSVYPGYGGQSLIPEVLDKCSELNDIRQKNGYKFEIEMDGGINLNNAGKAIEAGVDIIVAGDGIFKSQDPKGAIQDMRRQKK